MKKEFSDHKIDFKYPWIDYFFIACGFNWKNKMFHLWIKTFYWFELFLNFAFNIFDALYQHEHEA